MSGASLPGPELADLIGRGDPGTLPQRICLACVTLLPVTGAAISVRTGPGQLATVAASDDVAGRIEELQFTVGVGPCIDALNGGGPVLVRDVADTTDPVGARWPAFTGAAVGAGVRAVYAFPLSIGAIALGALNLYRDTPGLLSDTELSHALHVADATALALLDMRVAGSYDDADSTPSSPLDGGRFHLTEVYQATGMIMVQLGVSVEVALIRLRAFAFGHDRPIGDVARSVVVRRLRFDMDQ